MDIWALGCIFYELACGKKVFSEDWATLEYALNPYRQPRPFSTVFPKSVEKILHSSFVAMLYLDPLKRPRVSSVNSALQLMRDDDRQDELFGKIPNSSNMSNDTQRQIRAEEKTVTAIALYPFTREAGTEIDLIEGETLHSLRATRAEVLTLLP